MKIKTGIFLSMLILFGNACSESEEGKPPVQRISSFSGQESSITYGSPVAVRIKKMDPDSLEPPTEVPVGNFPRVVPDRRRVIPVKAPEVVKVPDTLTVLTPGENGVPLPEKVPARGKVVPAIYPPPVPALPLQKKDNAVTKIRYLDVDQGMSAAGVWSMMEDSRGNFWFGTIGGGASRYGGSDFTHYTMEEG